MLDEFQEEFCRSESDNIRLLAPAGSGKTHSLLHRCHRRYAETDGKSRFLIVTFTRAAKDELQARLNSQDFARIASSTDVTTLNSWGWRRVRDRHHSPRLITTTTDRSFAVQNSLQPIWSKSKKIESAFKKQRFVAGKVILNLMDQMKNLGFDHLKMKDVADADKHIQALEDVGLGRFLPQIAQELVEIGAVDRDKAMEAFAMFFPFWKKATKSLIDQSIFTLEDQKYVALRDIEEQISDGRFPSGGSKYSDILIDEFQDIGPLDLQLIRAIAKLHRARIVIVGDDDQAIFEWRGATPNYILTPDKWFGKKFSTHVLEKNYRCPRNIVTSSDRLIRNNRHRHVKNVIPVSTEDAEILLIENDEFTGSIEHVVSEVEHFVQRKDIGRERIALVSRKRAQLIPYQIMLAQKDIPFCAAEDLQVFLSEAFESLVDLLTIRMTADDRRLSRKVIDDVLRLCGQVKRYPLSKSDQASVRSHLAGAKPRSVIEAIDAIELYRGPLKGENKEGQMSLSFAEALRAYCESETVSEAVEAISDCFSGLQKDYGKAEEDIFYSDPPFHYLARYADRYGDDFEQFLDDIEAAADTLSNAPSEEDAKNPVWERPVHLMTALRAKGKEFHTVVILDANEGIWPSKQAETAEQIEGERRIFYVAMTRAKRRLLFTLSKKIGSSVASPSSFLAESGLLRTLV
ncbi:ATP-dependent helicase [Qipengyuania citrea]|jgi:DNA helicase-2/ATP-dependent DNA helicase PcrA|uniref:ATP-dependent helicase n=1 Tax=Qipengyuania citrea TaxID=225971 RepID=UPI0032994800